MYEHCAGRIRLEGRKQIEKLFTVDLLRVILDIPLLPTAIALEYV